MKAVCLISCLLHLCICSRLKSSKVLTKEVELCENSSWSLIQNSSFPSGEAELQLVVDKGYENGIYDVVLACGGLIVQGAGIKSVELSKKKTTYVQFGIKVPIVLDTNITEALQSCIYELKKQPSLTDPAFKVLSECKIRIKSPLLRLVPHCNKINRTMVKYIEVKTDRGRANVHLENSENDVVRIGQHCKNDFMSKYLDLMNHEGELYDLTSAGTSERIFSMEFFPGCEELQASAFKQFQEIDKPECYVTVHILCQEGEVLLKTFFVDLDKESMHCMASKSALENFIDNAKLKFGVESNPIAVLLCLLVFNILLYLLLLPCLFFKCVIVVNKLAKEFSLKKIRHKIRLNRAKKRLRIEEKDDDDGDSSIPPKRSLEMEFDDGDVLLTYETTKNVPVIPQLNVQQEPTTVMSDEGWRQDETAAAGFTNSYATREFISKQDVPQDNKSESLSTESSDSSSDEIQPLLAKAKEEETFMEGSVKHKTSDLQFNMQGQMQSRRSVPSHYSTPDVIKKGSSSPSLYSVDLGSPLGPSQLESEKISRFPQPMQHQSSLEKPAQRPIYSHHSFHDDWEVELKMPLVTHPSSVSPPLPKAKSKVTPAAEQKLSSKKNILQPSQSASLDRAGLKSQKSSSKKKLVQPSQSVSLDHAGLKTQKPYLRQSSSVLLSGAKQKPKSIQSLMSKIRLFNRSKKNALKKSSTELSASSGNTGFQQGSQSFHYPTNVNNSFPMGRSPSTQEYSMSKTLPVPNMLLKENHGLSYNNENVQEFPLEASRDVQYTFVRRHTIYQIENEDPADEIQSLSSSETSPSPEPPNIRKVQVKNMQLSKEAIQKMSSTYSLPGPRQPQSNTPRFSVPFKGNESLLSPLKKLGKKHRSQTMVVYSEDESSSSTIEKRSSRYSSLTNSPIKSPRKLKIFKWLDAWRARRKSRRDSVNSRRDSVKSRKYSVLSRKYSVLSRKYSVKSRKKSVLDPVKSRKDSVKSRKDTVKSRKESVKDSLVDSVKSRKDSVLSRDSVKSRKDSVKSRKDSVKSRKDSVLSI